MSYARLQERLGIGATIVIDGGTGTDIQRRGVPMDGASWCAQANRTHPDVVRAVHAEYLDAGAELLIANTFATSPLLFDGLGRIDEMVPIDAVAVNLARRAAADHAERTGAPTAAVAGSFSTMRLVPEGTDRTRVDMTWTEADARALMVRKAEGLAAAGVDLIIMEMMRDRDFSLWATEAAMATGLPVWVGISVEGAAGDGPLHGYSRPDMPLADIVAPLVAAGPQVLAVMHTSVNHTGEALAEVRRHWTGPLGAYPESGYFTMPDWQFVDIIEPDALVAHTRTWQHDHGVTVIGGCCGTDPGHIRALAALR